MRRLEEWSHIRRSFCEGGGQNPAYRPSGIFLIIQTVKLLGYAIYLIYAGAGPVMDIPQEKLAGFTVVVIALYICLGLIVFGITSTVQKMSLF